jgi:DNA polymerase III delta prime subunit
MQDIQQIFNRIREAKIKQKDIRKMYKDALDNVMEYKDIQEKTKSLREKKKRVETTIKEQFSSEITKMEDLKIDIESDTQLLADIALAKVSKGELIEIKDENENEYEPIFNVRFKKIA